MSDRVVEPKGSPLGRYDQESGEELHEVRLLHTPLRLLAAGREHHEEVMREFALLALSEPTESDHVPVRMLDLIEVLGRRYAAASERPVSEIDAALARGEKTLDLIYHVPSHVADAAERLELLMAEADEFCRDRQLLALARPQLVVDFTRWYLEQFRVQLAGGDPVAWSGPLDV